MAIWAVLAIMTAAAAMAVLWPLSRHVAVRAASGGDTEFYRSQIAEIEHDLDRGLISPDEAEAARAEAARRVLRNARAEPQDQQVAEPALRRRRAASAIALSIVPLLALAVYGAYGSPNLPGRPLASRAEADAGRNELAAAVARIEAHLRQNPNDGRGWEVVAPVYLRGGRAEDAAKAYESALRLLGETPARLANYGEALVFARDGVVPAEAKAAFERALALDPAASKARFYLARAAEQDGDVAQAIGLYAALAEASPPDAPWLPAVQGQLARLRGAPATAIAGLPEGERADAIRGMVEGLAARLDQGGGTSEEWSRLVRSYMVLGERGKAADALTKGRRSLASRGVSSTPLDALAQGYQLDGGAGAP